MWNWVTAVDGSTWIALGALIVAVLARIDGYRERRERQQQASIERSDREREAQELRKRIARSEIANLGARQQDVVSANDGDTYSFTIENAGPAVARDVVARIVAWDRELGIGERVAVEFVKTAIGVGRDVTIKMHVPSGDRGGIELQLWADWQDDRERHSDSLLTLEPPPEPGYRIY